jgi:endonuclease/exonuclease/phosphatase family metal-dependent hydrolase
MRDEARITIVTYNIHSCVGTDGRYNPERIGAVIASLDADVVALQEVESPSAEHGDPDQLARLARASGYPPGIAGPTLHRGTVSFGNAMLTRSAVAAVRKIDLSVNGREPRGAIDVDVLWRGSALRVVTTHLGLRGEERTEQWRRLLTHWTASSAPAVLLGDFNHWWWRDRLLAGVERQLGATPALRTFPSRRPIFALDRLWVQPRSALRSLRVIATPLARVASDHLPLRAEIALMR